MNLLRAASIVSLLTFASRVTGLVRELLIAASFGASAWTDAFNVAFRIPNLLRRLFAEGAFAQAFVPILAETRARDGDAVTQRLIDAVATVLAWALLATCIVGVLAAPLLVWLIGSGLSAVRRRGADDALDVPLHRLHVAGGAVGRHAQHLAALCRAGRDAGAAQPGASSPRPWWLAPQFARGGIEPIYALAAGVDARRRAAARGAGAGAARASAALPHLGLGPGALRAAWRHPGVRRVLRQMGPALLGVSVAQLSLLINTQIASHLAVGAVSWLNYADRLMEFPTGAARRRARRGAAAAAVGRARAGRRAGAIPACSTGACASCVLLALPCAVALLVFARPLVAVALPLRRLHRARRAADGARADGLRRRPARADRRQGAGARLLRAPGHPHAGAHRDRRAGR